MPLLQVIQLSTHSGLSPSYTHLLSKIQSPVHSSVDVLLQISRILSTGTGGGRSLSQVAFLTE